MTEQSLHIETIDTPTWHAVLVMEQRPRLGPEIICIGFQTAKKRDDWLGYFAASVRNLASALPTRSVP
jgi:hypothetical protein